MTGEDLGYKPDVIQNAKLEYSPLGKVFNKGLDESNKKSLLKRLNNIESKNEQQLEAIKDQGEMQLDAIKDYSAKKKLKFSDEKNQRAKTGKKVDYKKLLFVHSNGRLNNFNGFTKIEDLENNLYWGHISIKQTKNEQNIMEKLISDLDKYKSGKESRKKSRDETLDNAKKNF